MEVLKIRYAAGHAFVEIEKDYLLYIGEEELVRELGNAEIWVLAMEVLMAAKGRHIHKDNGHIH